MKRELLLLRHGKSDWDVNASDLDRPLKDRGKRGAQRMATWLHQHGLRPDLVISSPAVRALETARKASKTMELSADAIVTEDAIYHASLDDLLGVVRALPADAKRVMLVGHNPGLEDFLLYLADGPISLTKNGKLLPTASLAHLELTTEWDQLSPGGATIKNLVRPVELPKKFPFPAPDGKERRDRPAYYYRQSSVIPFRLTDRGMEILVILSSKKKHFVVPKGIHDPGLSAEASAAKEAWEEAGVRGEISGNELGRYKYEKWGAECTVTVFPMHVSEVVAEQEWEESHRGRQWVSPEEAATKLKQKALIPMIRELQRRHG